MFTLTPAIVAVVMGAGAVAGCLGALLGIGGGVFLVPFLHVVIGLPLNVASGIGLMTVIGTSSVVSANRAGRRLVNLRLGMLMQVPASALVHDPTGQRYLVYTVEQNGGRSVAKAIPVEPGPLAGNEVVVLSGLTAGQKIVVMGANLLQPGDPVKEVE